MHTIVVLFCTINHRQCGKCLGWVLNSVID